MDVDRLKKEEMYEAIFKRRSVRRYAGPLDAGALAEVESFARFLKPLHPDIRTEVRVLNDDGVRGPFKVAAPHFLAIYSEAADYHAANAGFMLQQMDLFLSSQGIGSCWQGGPKPAGDAKKVSGLNFVISLAFGRPGEDVHRRSVAEFKRKPMRDITDTRGMDDMLEAARLAPSGMNRQSWYFTGNENAVEVHYARSVMTDQMNRINAGIALCHLWLAALHAGRSGEVVIEPSGRGASPKGYTYVASIDLSRA